MSSEYSREYLESVLEQTKAYVPDWLWSELHRLALPSAGGRARHRPLPAPNELEKLALQEMRPAMLERVSDAEVGRAWHRLSQWYASAKRRRVGVEEIVNAARWVIAEAKKRGIHIDEDSDLAQDAAKLEQSDDNDKAKKSSEEPGEPSMGKVGELWQLSDHEDVVVVPEFVSIVGGAVQREDANDVDVVIRADKDDDDDRFSISAYSIELPVRKVLDPEKEGYLHYIANPQGPHSDYVPLYDLVLRARAEPEIKIVKANYARDRCMECSDPPTVEFLWAEGRAHAWFCDKHAAQFRREHPDDIDAEKKIEYGIARRKFSDPKSPQTLDKDLRLDLGCGNAKSDGYIGIDKEPGDQVDIVHDLEQGIPCPNNSASEIIAHHVLEHLPDQEAIMAEIWRVLAPGGRAIITVPSTKGEGAFADPTHKTYWNRASFLYWTERTDHRPRFELESLQEWDYGGGKIDVEAVLRKPVIGEEVAKATFAPIMRPRVMPKPAMKLRAHTDAFSPDEIWDWVRPRLGEVVAEPKYNGFRGWVQKKGPRISILFEGMSEEKYDKLAAADKGLRLYRLPDCILDCDIGVAKNGQRWSRASLATLNADEPKLPPRAHIVVTAFDVLYWKGEDLHQRPFRERRKVLESARRELAIAGVLIPPQMRINSKQDLVEAWKSSRFGKAPSSEGLVLKDEDWKYELVPGTNGMAKIKHVMEVKAIALEAQKKENGWIIRGGLLPDDLGAENLRELDGKEYVDLGFSFVGKIHPKIGDICTFQVEEINWDAPDKRLNWLGAIPLDVDKARKTPYSAGQVVTMAERAGVLNEAAEAVKMVKGQGAEGSIAFVGSVPSPLECVRDLPLAGPDGATFRDLYLAPLGLQKSDVFVTNLVPVPLGRAPTDEECELWRGHLIAELSEAQPLAIVALGKQAAEVLGEDACLWLPHPAAVRRRGDSGEVRRKLARLRTIVRKATELGDEGEESQPATRLWLQEWHERLPPSGRGKFVYQHHWRGLSEEEIRKPTEETLLATDHSVHGDLRMTSSVSDELWGISIFIGRTADNRAGDRLIRLRETDDNLQFIFKPPQPEAWLRVGVKRPYIAAPGESGATSKSYAVINAIDAGEYRVGVAREHLIELFFEGDKLKGRYLLEYAPVGGGSRTWIIDAPDDQRPYAETHELEDVMAELKSKGQRWLYWSDGKSKPVLYDVRSGKKVSKARVNFVKADDEKQIVYGVVSEPDVEDTQGDVITADTIEDACHEYMRSSRVVGLDHRQAAPAELVECYTAPVDFEWHEQQVRKGTWLIAVHVSDNDLWKQIKEGTYTGFSLGGFGIRHRMDEE